MTFRLAAVRVMGGLAFLVLLCSATAFGQEVPASLRASIDLAVANVKPAIVRIEVVSAHYHEGREFKYQSSGSGVIITKEGHVVTNHHVAGHATRLVCTLATKQEVEAEVVGKDPLTDLAVIKLMPEQPCEFPTAPFGDSSQVRVGEHVLAMGSPMALSQSVTLGIVSNTELVMPEWLGRWGMVRQDGEDVGSLVRWIGHDAPIYGGNSGGPLVSLRGEIIGINEIRVGGLGGAIPGNLAAAVAKGLIEEGRVERAWLGVQVQQRLKHADQQRGVLISGTYEGSPAEKAGMQSGDLLVRLGGSEVDVRFLEQLPTFNQMVADLPIGEEVEAGVLRGGEEVALTLTPIEREEAVPEQHELKQWGITARDISFMIAQELKRDNQDGVLITSVRPGGPSGDAKPDIRRDDVLVEVDGKPVKDLAALQSVTAEVTKGQEDPVPTLVGFDRGTERYLTVVKVGIRELEDPGLEVKKAWLPVKTQVLTRDIAGELETDDLTGFRVTQVFKGSTAEAAGLQVGDYLLSVDGEKLTATDPEDYDDLPQLIRQYKVGSTAEITVLRNEETLTIPVELVRAPKLSREMKRYRDDRFDLTVRDITFFDKAEEKWRDEQKGVLVEEVQSGGWAAVGLVEAGDLLTEVNGEEVTDVESLKPRMEALSEAKPKSVVFKVRRGIHTIFLELEPKWDDAIGKE